MLMKKITDIPSLYNHDSIYIFIDKYEMSAIHKLGLIIKIEVHNYIKVEVIRNV